MSAERCLRCGHAPCLAEGGYESQCVPWNDPLRVWRDAPTGSPRDQAGQTVTAAGKGLPWGPFDPNGDPQ